MRASLKRSLIGAALTLVLTLYVGFLAVNLLTGRSRLGLSMLTPRAFALGLALTFATSWIAYQSVVWNLAVGAPDQIASVVVGTRGSATVVFADRLDDVFNAVAEAAASAQAAQSDSTPKAAGFTPADIVWLGAMLLLLGTVGILLVTRIALAALLALGPVFVILSLFRGTRGLFEGWLKSVALFAFTPMFAVLIGSGALAMLMPVIASLRGGEIDMRAAVTVLLAAIVYCALMAIVLKVSVTITSGWRLPGSADPRGATPERMPWGGSQSLAPHAAAMAALPGSIARPIANDRVREIVAGAGANPTRAEAPEAAMSTGADRVRSVTTASVVTTASPPLLIGSDARARGIGSQFRLPTSAREKLPC